MHLVALLMLLGAGGDSSRVMIYAGTNDSEAAQALQPLLENSPFITVQTVDQDLVSIRYTKEKSTYTFLITPRTYSSGLDYLYIMFPLSTPPDASPPEVLKMENRVNLRYHPIRASFIPKDSLLVLDTWVTFKDTLYLSDVEQALSEFLYFCKSLWTPFPSTTFWGSDHPRSGRSVTTITRGSVRASMA